MNLDLILRAQREKGQVTDLVLTGGGAKGDVLAQILADVLGTAAVAGSVCGYSREWDINGEKVILGVRKEMNGGEE